VRHAIPVEDLGPQGSAMAGAIESCVHCGFCLPTCPTYVTMREEMDSPRGRIFLMKEVLEGQLEIELALPYVDNCLGCQACVTACPSGVAYGELITPFRAHAEEHRRRTLAERLQRALTLRVLPHPGRFRAAARVARLGRPVARRLPVRAAAMLELLPAELPAPAPLPACVPAEGERRARVALLAGCAQQVLAPDINWATLRVLARNGVETVIPPEQGCCGALALHAGAAGAARSLAKRNLAAFGGDVDAVLTNAAGCGSGMREYRALFAGTSFQEAVEAFADRVVDVSVFLASLGLRAAPPPLSAPLRVAYQDACHLAHAQGVRREPRELLASITGLELVEPAEWELCCGSAGTYNVDRPDTARALGARKAKALRDTGAALVATGNIGCLTQLRSHGVEILHTMQVLDRAYRGTLAAR
jgi:glycolate oxidase iron-sulfur subunit